MIFFKACPRCGGDMFDDYDIYGSFVDCLQCGYIINFDTKKRRMTREEVVSLMGKELGKSPT